MTPERIAELRKTPFIFEPEIQEALDALESAQRERDTAEGMLGRALAEDARLRAALEGITQHSCSEPSSHCSGFLMGSWREIQSALASSPLSAAAAKVIECAEAWYSVRQGEHGPHASIVERYQPMADTVAELRRLRSGT